jgi:imidazolonepropionase
MWDTLWINVHAATMDAPAGACNPAGIVRNAAIAATAGKLAWVGPMSACPGDPARLARTVHDGGGRLATPALIDCHTHLLFGGDRAAEFARRAEGASYADIAAGGGGIRTTVAATRALDVAGLVEQALPRARALLAEGVTTIEVKSGYALTVEGELTMLRAARALGDAIDATVVPTLLALHALPPEYAHDRAGWVRAVTAQLIPAVAAGGLAAAVDVFCEGIAFSVEECAAVLMAARRHGWAAHVHADQLTPMGAATMAAHQGALSADHVEYTDAAGVAAMAAAGTVAVLLPVAFLVTGESRKPPVAALRAAGVPMAIATDCNPGTSPCASISVALAMARAQFGLTALEALAGVTVNAARALGLGASHGRLAAGCMADLCLWDFDAVDGFGYWLHPVHPATIVRGGRTRVPG